MNWWFAVDDKFSTHRKVRALGRDRLAAVGLWTLCGSWSAGTGEGGFIPTEIVRQHDPKLRLAARLVDVGLWESARRGGEVGYQFHDWTDKNPDEASAKAFKTKARGDTALGNHTRWHTRRGLTVPNCPYCQIPNSVPNGSPPDSLTESLPLGIAPSPSPSPSPKDKSPTAKESPTSVNGSRSTSGTSGAHRYETQPAATATERTR